MDALNHTTIYNNFASLSNGDGKKTKWRIQCIQDSKKISNEINWM